MPGVFGGLQSPFHGTDEAPCPKAPRRAVAHVEFLARTKGPLRAEMNMYKGPLVGSMVQCAKSLATEAGALS